MPKGYVMAVMHNVPKGYPEELAKEIFAAIGDTKHIEIWGQEILVAPFIQSATYGSGTILRGEKEQEEDKWQAKSFLVLKIGNGVEKACKQHGLPMPIVGEWYFGDVKEHWMLNIRGKNAKGRKEPGATQFYRPWGDGGWPCRMVLLSDIRGKTTRPQDVM